MAGQIKRLIESLVETRSNGNPTIASFVRAHLKLKGVDPDRFGPDSFDDPAILAKLRQMANDFGNS